MCPTLNPIPEQSITELHYHSIKHFIKKYPPTLMNYNNKKQLPQF